MSKIIISFLAGVILMAVINKGRIADLEFKNARVLEDSMGAMRDSISCHVKLGSALEQLKATSEVGHE